MKDKLGMEYEYSSILKLGNIINKFNYDLQI